MVTQCWKCYGLVGHYWTLADIDNIRDSPVLPVLDYVPKSMGHPAWSDVCSESTTLWREFCGPEFTATYPITSGPMTWDVTRQPTTLYTVDGKQRYMPPTGDEYLLDRGFAVACRITPTSRCLPYIMFHYTKSLNESIPIIIEIRANDPTTNLPVGTPRDNNILGRVTYSGFKTKAAMDCDFGCWYINLFHYAVPINTILDEIDVPVWIVLYSNDYACSNAFVGTAHRRLQLYKSTTPDNNVAIFSESTGCQWAIDASIKSLAFATYKSATCNGTVVINDYAFAKIETPPSPPTYLNTNCFVRLQDVYGSKVSVGVIYTNPDPIRSWRRVRFSFVYRKPDLKYHTETVDVFNVSPGQHETFFELNNYYFTGNYDQLSVSTTVVQV